MIKSKENGWLVLLLLFMNEAYPCHLGVEPHLQGVSVLADLQSDSRKYQDLQSA